MPYLLAKIRNSIDYEADLRTPVPFEYSPSIAILLVLLSTSLSYVRPSFRFKIICNCYANTRSYGTYVSRLLIRSPFPGTRHTSYRHSSIALTSRPRTLGECRSCRFSDEYQSLDIANERTSIHFIPVARFILTTRNRPYYGAV